MKLKLKYVDKIVVCDMCDEETKVGFPDGWKYYEEFLRFEKSFRCNRCKSEYSKDED